MGDVDIMKVIIAETCLSYAPAEVNVFTVHKERGIKQACLIKRFPADEHEGSGKDVSAAGFDLRLISQVVCIEEGGAREESAQAGKPEK